MRKTDSFPFKSNFLDRLLAWSQQFERVCFLDSSRHPNSGNGNEPHSLIAIGVEAEITADSGNAFETWKNFQLSHKDWLFGYLAYDLKNEVERLESKHPDGVQFPDLHFFQPTYVFQVDAQNVRISSLGKSPEEVFATILATTPIPETAPGPSPLLQARLSRKEYLNTLGHLKQHIRQGDIYEINYCQEFFAEQVSLDPYATFQRLNRLSPTPFAAFYRLDERFLMCGSPERFLHKVGDRLISQPIKGTARRGDSPEEDQQLRHDLLNSAKDRSENVMIVDLVRNDLSRSAQPETVKVEELFGIYTFPKVHQMISTVTSRLQKEVHPCDAIRYAFPMGSMTGAPKIRAMQLIEEYEHSRRGLYSGAVGYFTPEGDFDFNVVIRSLLYHRPEGYLSFQVGGAIIDASDPEAEYEECMIKASPLLETLGLSNWKP